MALTCWTHPPTALARFDCSSCRLGQGFADRCQPSGDALESRRSKLCLDLCGGLLSRAGRCLRFAHMLDRASERSDQLRRIRHSGTVAASGTRAKIGSKFVDAVCRLLCARWCDLMDQACDAETNLWRHLVTLVTVDHAGYKSDIILDVNG